MKLVTAAQMRELDRRTIEEVGTPSELLMERAGRGVAVSVMRLAELSGRLGCIRCVAGKGNNAGDAFVVARCLHEAGLSVELVLAAEAGDLQGDAKRHFTRMREAGVNPVTLSQAEGLPPDDLDANRELVVEGILGTGIAGAPRGAAAKAIAHVNRLGQCRPVIAIDSPSGLNCDSGVAEGEVVHADLTVTMGLPKAGLVVPAAADYVGTVEVIDIGIPDDYTKALESDSELITAADLRPLFARRRRASHKGTFGHVLLMGGSSHFSGAIAMAAMSALRSGAGLVSVLTPPEAASTVAALAPEAMVHAARGCTGGALTAAVMGEWSHSLDDFDAVLMGPGLTRSAGALQLVERVLDTCRVPLVLDADALPDADHAVRLSSAEAPLVLTPHPGELARLLGIDVDAVQAERQSHAVDTADKTGATVVLKGHGTLIARTGETPAINTSGNPGMASGGMGDVLAGLLTGLVAQGLSPFDAARAAVYLHGAAADVAAWRDARASLTAQDVIRALPLAFRDVAVL